ncbi:hypothetical protein [Methanoculleus chikugoensis]|nr:hypothetical protein [Methanoculleus chikugoensis]
MALGGYSDWSTTVQVGAGSTASASASLSPVPTQAPPTRAWHPLP